MTIIEKGDEMGLDNGIMLKCKNKIDLSLLPWFVNIELDKYSDDRITYEYEITYFRKCWGIRGEVCMLLHSPEDGGYSTIDPEDIPAIIRILEKYSEKEYWDENADSIWEYDEQIHNIRQTIKNLLWLKEYLENNKDNVDECYWYDSY